MEVSLIGSSQVNLVGTNLGNRETGICSHNTNLNIPQFNSHKTSNICLRIRRPFRSSAPLVIKASAFPQSEAVISGNRRSINSDSLRLYVGLPLDAVSYTCSINHARAIEAGLKALKLLGVEGVELPVWWGIAEREAMGNYNWNGYLALAEMVQKIGLKLHVSLYFNACNQHQIPLPEWVSRIGENQPDIFFADRLGQRYKDCLSLSVDDLPILDGKTPLEVYKDFYENFKTAFAQYLDSTVTGISIGLGPNGELRYPSNHIQGSGAGEFQCYDKTMLSNLKQHAEASGNPLWGLSGPHDNPKYDDLPIANGFFKEDGGSWETPYGSFFLSWYSGQLISHGERILSLAVSTFRNYPVAIHGKVPLVHTWYRTRSHPSETMAGYYNTDSRDGYEAVMEMFARNSCKIILPGMDLSDKHQPKESLSGPESLLQHITSSCKKHGVEICGQNSMAPAAAEGMEKMKNYLLGSYGPSLFIYERMGAHFFSPQHFPSFTQFVRNLSQPQLHQDDLPVAGADSVESVSAENLQMQAAS